MAKFIKKPVVIEAFQLTYEMAKGNDAVPIWFADAAKNESVKVFLTDKIHGSQYCEIKTSEGVMIANATDWIIKEPFPINDRTIYPCKPDIFEKTYEKVEE